MTSSKKEYEYSGKVAAGYDAAMNYVIGQDARRETGEWLSGQFKATDNPGNWLWPRFFFRARKEYSA